MDWPFRDEAEMLEVFAKRVHFPDSYVVADVETTGFSPTKDLIIEVGWGVVKDRKLVHSAGLILDWTTFPDVDHDFIYHQLVRQAEQYRAQGRPHYFSWERIANEGMPPLEVLHAFSTLLYEYIMQDLPIVGHNFWRFDRLRVNAHTQRFLQGYLLPWKDTSIWDTGLIEKAAQMCRPIYQNETLDAWYTRVDNAYSRCKWNMQRCAEKYDLARRYGLDMRLQHTSGFDCQLTHALLETYRELMEILRGERTELSQVQTKEEAQGGPQGQAAHGQTGHAAGPGAVPA